MRQETVGKGRDFYEKLTNEQLVKIVSRSAAAIKDGAIVEMMDRLRRLTRICEATPRGGRVSSHVVRNWRFNIK